MIFCRGSNGKAGYFTKEDGSVRDDFMLQYIFLHELMHHAPFKADDRSYIWERVLNVLSTRQALKNADSIVLFMMDIKHPDQNARTKVLKKLDKEVPSDSFFGFEPTKESQLKEALAWAEKWNTYAYSGINQTYGDWDIFLKMKNHITRWLGRVNRYSLAGIYDRYKSLRSIYSKSLKFKHQDVKSGCTKPVMRDPATDTFLVCDTFFKLSKRQRIIKVYAEIAKKVPEIPEKHREGYARLARAYKLFHWKVH